DRFFDFHAEMRGIADRAGDFPDGHLPRGMAEALLIAPVFGEPVGDFQAEGNGLSVKAVRAADLWDVLRLVRARLQHVSEPRSASVSVAASSTSSQRSRRP